MTPTTQILDLARISHHALTAAGATFSIPASDNITTWNDNATYLRNREFGINLTDKILYLRIDNEIVQVYPGSGGGTVSGTPIEVPYFDVNGDLTSDDFFQRLVGTYSETVIGATSADGKATFVNIGELSPTPGDFGVRNGLIFGDESAVVQTHIAGGGGLESSLLYNLDGTKEIGYYANNSGLQFQTGPGVRFNMPLADGANGEFLSTDGTGNLSFTSSNGSLTGTDTEIPYFDSNGDITSDAFFTRDSNFNTTISNDQAGVTASFLLSNSLPGFGLPFIGFGKGPIGGGSYSLMGILDASGFGQGQFAQVTQVINGGLQANEFKTPGRMQYTVAQQGVGLTSGTTLSLETRTASLRFQDGVTGLGTRLELNDVTARLYFDGGSDWGISNQNGLIQIGNLDSANTMSIILDYTNNYFIGTLDSLNMFLLDDTSTNFGRGAAQKNTFGNANVNLGYFAGAGLTGSSYQYTVNIGYEAALSLTSGVENVIIGYQAGLLATELNSVVAVGVGSISNSDVNISSSVFIGKYARGASGSNGSIALGREAFVTTSNQFVAGSQMYPLTETVFGGSIANTSPKSYTFRTSDGSGFNIPGWDMTVAAGRGTGTASGGSLILSSALNSPAPGIGLNTKFDFFKYDGFLSNIVIGDVNNATPGKTRFAVDIFAKDISSSIDGTFAVLNPSNNSTWITVDTSNSNRWVKLGDTNAVGNSTTLNVVDSTQSIDLVTNNLTINTLAGFSGTFSSAGGQTVTVTKGIITSVA